VILVQPNTDHSEFSEAPTRIRAELETAGFDVEIVAGDPSLGPREQLEHVEQQSASGPTPVATIVLASAGTGADIWIADRVTAKTTVRRIDIPQTSQAASILAVRTVELLRASLLEARPPKRATTEATAPPAAESLSDASDGLDFEDETSPTIWGPAIDLGILALFGLNGIRPHLGPSLRLSLGTLDFKGRLSIAAPVIGERLEQAQGAAAVKPLLAQLDLVASFPVQRQMRLYGALGFGGYWVAVEGEAIPPAVAHDESAIGATFQLGAGAQIELSPRLWLFAEPQLVWLLPAIAVRIANQEAGRIGHPALSGTVGLTWLF
jgi:hypothetical protein